MLRQAVIPFLGFKETVSWQEAVSKLCQREVVKGRRGNLLWDGIATATIGCLAMTNDIGLESDYSHSKKDKSMFSKRSQLLVIITILFSFSLACALTGGASEPNRPDQDAIEAAVAQTLAAGAAASSAVEPETEAEPLLEPETASLLIPLWQKMLTQKMSLQREKQVIPGTLRSMSGLPLITGS